MDKTECSVFLKEYIQRQRTLKILYPKYNQINTAESKH